MEETLSVDLKIIVFQLNEKEYAIPVEQVRSIEKIQHITRVPGTASYIKGVINLRGVVTPIVDLRIRFGLDQVDDQDQSRIIITVVDNIEVGLIVDAANDVIDISKDDIEPAPEIVSGTEESYVNGVIKLGKRLLILLELGKVLNEINNEINFEG